MNRLHRLLRRGPFGRVRRALHGHSYTAEIAGTSLRFHLLTRAEHRRFAKLTPSERPVIEDLVARVEPRDVFYDIGANVGVYTCVLAAHVERVIAFEPDPETATRAEANVQLNGLAGVATVHRSALSDATGTTRLAKGGDGVVGEGRYALTRDAGPGTITVETNTGDDLVADGVVPPPDVLKIDVEGTESAVLDGLKDTLARPTCRLLYCEVHPERLDGDSRSAESIRESLERSGFVVTRIHDRGEEYFLRARKPRPESADGSRTQPET